MVHVHQINGFPAEPACLAGIAPIQPLRPEGHRGDGV